MINLSRKAIIWKCIKKITNKNAPNDEMDDFRLRIGADPFHYLAIFRYSKLW